MCPICYPTSLGYMEKPRQVIESWNEKINQLNIDLKFYLTWKKANLCIETAYKNGSPSLSSQDFNAIIVDQIHSLELQIESVTKIKKITETHFKEVHQSKLSSKQENLEYYLILYKLYQSQEENIENWRIMNKIY